MYAISNATVYQLSKYNKDIDDICLVQCTIRIYFTERALKGIFHEWHSHEWNINFWFSRGEIYFNLTLNLTNFLYIVYTGTFKKTF
jgi:hypothetical protein